MVELLVYLAIVVIIVLVVYYLLSQLSLPEPIGKIINIALVVIVAIVLIGILLNLGGANIPLRLK